MSIRAPQQQPSKTPKTHIIGKYGRTKCNVMITMFWVETEEEANCKACLDHVSGWKALKKKWGQP